MTIDKSEFLEVVRKSGVVGESHLAEARASADQDTLEIAQRWVLQKVLTQWQAKYLLTGRHQLDIGPYRLLERTRRDELGDRFSAIHLQLGRSVDLQVLSAEVSKDQARCLAFIDRVGQTSVLDHPHLSHVYDVDKMGGRYYLVTEHIDGNCLSDISAETLNLPLVANWYQQAVAGLRYAQSCGIYHGDLQVGDLTVDPEQGIKIQNLAITGLRSAAGKQPGVSTAMNDWKMVGRIFQELMGRICSTDHPAEQAECFRLFQELRNVADPSDVDRIEGQISHVCSKLSNSSAANELPMRRDQIDDLNVEAFDKPLPTGSTLATATVKARRSNHRTRDSQPAWRAQSAPEDLEDLEDPWEPVEDGFFSRLAFGNPVGLLSSAFVVGLVVVGSLTYLMLGAFSGPQVAQRVGSEADLAARSDGTKTLVPTSLKNETSPATKAVDSVGELTSFDQLDSEAYIEKLQQAGLELENPPAPAADGTPQPDNPDLNNSESTNPPTENAMASPSVGDQAKFPAIPAHPVTETPVSAAAEQPPAQPILTGGLTAEELQKRMEQPFAWLPRQLALPGVDNPVEVKLGEVFIADRFLLGAEVVVNPGISNSKLHFETERDPGNNQRWLINLSRTPKDKKTPIAALRRDGRDLFFQWLPETKSNRQAGFLQNCLLNLFIPENSVLLALRTPVEIAPLVLSPEELSAETTFELDYSPNPKNLLIEVLPVTIPETRLSPSVIDIQDGIPGRILLKREDDKAFVWVNLAIDFKPKSRLRADLVVADGVRIRQLKNLKELQSLATTWKQYELDWTQKHQIADATPAPPGQSEKKQKFVAELNRQKNLAVTNATKFQQYVELAPKMMGQQYGIRIVARYEGQEVELARTQREDHPQSNATASVKSE